MSNFTDLIASAIERLCDEPCEGDVDVSGCSVLVPPLLDQRHHLGVGEAEQQRHEEALEARGDRGDDVVQPLQVDGGVLALGSHGQQQVVDAEDGDEEHGGLGLLQRGAVDGVRGVSPVLRRQRCVRPQLGPQHLDDIRQEHDVHDDDQDHRDGDKVVRVPE